MRSPGSYARGPAERENLLFALGEHLVGGCSLGFRLCSGEAGAERGVDVPASTGDFQYRDDYLSVGSLLEHVAGSPGAKRLAEDLLRIVLHRED